MIMFNKVKKCSFLKLFLTSFLSICFFSVHSKALDVFQLRDVNVIKWLTRMLNSENESLSVLLDFYNLEGNLDLGTTVCALGDKSTISLYNPINDFEGKRIGYSYTAIKILPDHILFIDLLNWLSGRFEKKINFEPLFLNATFCINPKAAEFLFENQFHSGSDDSNYFYMCEAKNGKFKGHRLEIIKLEKNGKKIVQKSIVI